MKIKCDYCDNTYEDTLPQCPYCEAPNPSHKHVNGTPRTIEELKQWYKARNLPPYETTRFFIGEDHKGPQAFGIYQDPQNGEFVVYKNKGDGSRAVRYRGGDEEYAVNEIYQKLKDEIVHQKSNQGRYNAAKKVKKNGRISISGLLGFIIFIICFIIYGWINSAQHKHDGYYQYGNTTYYNYDNNWYYYDNDDWYEVDSYYDDAPSVISESYDDYYMSENWSTDMDATDWDDSYYYDETHSSSSYDSDSDSGWDWGSDSDWDWDSGSDWDSGGSDWDSDW